MECKECQSRIGMSALSFTKCEECYIECISGIKPGYKLCINCSIDLGVCRQCKKKINNDG
jgi:hypothetical protein